MEAINIEVVENGFVVRETDYSSAVVASVKMWVFNSREEMYDWITDNLKIRTNNHTEK